MGRLGFYIDRQRCIGCKACQAACKDHNNLEMGIFFRNVFTYKAAEGNSLNLCNYSAACNHCEEPECVAVCPTGAMQKMDDGTVIYQSETCIACGSCVWGCPYGAPSFSKSGGVSQKCDSCAALRAKGKNPVCVDACITHCLQFGDLDELEQQYGKMDMGFFGGRTFDRTMFSKKEEPVRVSPPHLRSAERAVKDSDETFLILGAGIAGVQAAAAIRERNCSCRIILTEAEESLTYSRPMLTKAPLKGFMPERHFIHDAFWFGRQRIELNLGYKATVLNTEKKTAVFEDGSVLHYDKCIYALGAECFVPPIPGCDKERVVTIRRSSDIEKIRRMGLTSKKVVIIGGGVIGVEIAWELRKAGMEVTIIEMAGMLMERLLDESNARYLEASLRNAGLSLVTAARITGIEGGRCAERVVLEGGESYPADFVILSAGIRANVQLAQMAEIEIGRSIIVNESMETSALDVYACGDCAEYHGYNSGTWAESQSQGAVAGANAAGDALSWKLQPAPLMLHAGGISLFAIGDVGKNPKQSYVIYKATTQPDPDEFLINKRPGSGKCYETYYISNHKLAGAILMGDLTKMRLIKECMINNSLLPQLLETLSPKETDMIQMKAQED
ncbi:MAG: FAD-dependent oxidoreductase [Lachnospiraceae bacterium]